MPNTDKCHTMTFSKQYIPVSHHYFFNATPFQRVLIYEFKEYTLFL